VKLNFWHFVAGLFALYGIILFFTGVYYVAAGSVDPATRGHPSIWWGLLLVLASVCFWLIARKVAKSSSHE